LNTKKLVYDKFWRPKRPTRITSTPSAKLWLWRRL